MAFCEVTVLKECGYEEALFGVGFNKNLSSDYSSFEVIPVEKQEQLKRVAEKLAFCDGGHNKFLEQIYVWLDVTAPRYVWAEMDTFRMSTKNSQSTMHTLMKELKTKDINALMRMFEYGSIDVEQIEWMINVANKDELSENTKLIAIKQRLPEGFLQRRLWTMSFKTLRNIANQRMTHHLPHWQMFLDKTYSQLKHPELLPELIFKG